MNFPKPDKYFSLFLWLSVLSSCTKDEFGVPSDCKNLTGWLKKGYQWTYAFHSPYIHADTLTLTVDDEIRPGVFAVSTVADDTNFYAVGTKYLQPCYQDIYISGESSMKIAFITYKVDGSVGEKWHYSMPTSRGYTATVSSEIVEKDVPVTVDAGTFSCLHIFEELTSTDTTALDVTTDYFLNNDIGIVKVHSTLQDYSLARKNF